jgi:outer membrane protein assembly factor BamB
MTTNEFIDLLDRRRMVPDKVVRQLRAKAAEGDDRITPKSILKYLVKKEVVTRAQAKELLETTLVVSTKTESSILGLVPLDDVPEIAAKPAKAAKPKEPSTPRSDSAPPAPSRRSAPVAPVEDDPVLLEPIDSVGFGLSVGDEPDPFAADAHNDPLSAEDAPLAGGTRGKGKRIKKRKRSKGDKGKSEWDSPLLLLGGTGLAVLVVAGIVLYWLLTRENADLLLKQANENYEGGSYTQAIADYQRFVTNHSSHQDFSHAKVRLGLAELWRDTEGGTDYVKALATAQRVIKNIEDEPAFMAAEDDSDQLSEGKRELSALLTTIAAGLAQQAEEAEDPKLVEERVDQINTVLGLTSNTKYVPQRLRNDVQLNSVRDTLERVKQRQQRDADLAAGLAKMDEAVAQGDTATAFDVQRQLVDAYPVLRENELLHRKILSVAEAERGLVKFVEQRKTASTEAAPSSIVAELALADRRGEPVAAEGIALVQVDGAVYALKAADGSLLWRRFVGLEGHARPLTLPNGAVVAADSAHGDLVCLDGQSGKLAWRQPLEGTLATPVLAGGRLIIASDSGRLYVVEPASGELVGHVQFSQPLRVAPATNERGDRIYVLGEHSNIYTISGSDFSCLGVNYLGHAAGGIATPPVVVLNKVIVADNDGAETCRIRVLSTNADGAVDKEVVSHRVTGLIVTPLQTAGRRLAVVTTRGQATVFETSGENDASALVVLATREPQDREQSAQFGVIHDGHLWVAGKQLVKLAIRPTGNQLPVQSIERDYRGDAFDYPLQSIGDFIVHVRRPAGRAGALVSITSAAGAPGWETELAAPPAGMPAVDASGLKVTAGTASGAIYLLDRDAMTRRVQDRAERAATADRLPPMTDSLPLPQGRLVVGGIGASALLHYRPGSPRQTVHAVDLPGPLSCAPVAWGDGFVVATDVGQVALLSAEDASPLAEPFQPELRPGRKYKWLRPAVIGEGAGSQLVVSDGVEKIYLVGLAQQPRPHLQAAASANIGGSPLATPLAAAGARVFAGNENGQLVSFSMPELAIADPVDLGARVTWGPFAAGDGVLLATEGKQLILVGPDGAVKWRQPLKHGEPGGRPLVDGAAVLLLVPSAGVARVSLADGAEQGWAELGQPALAGPVAFGPRLVASAADGTILVVNRP